MKLGYPYFYPSLPGAAIKIGVYLLLACIGFACRQQPQEPVPITQSVPEKIDFNFHVRPILSDRCFACHGPDEKAREADLRLDLPETAFAKLKETGHYAIVKGNPSQSTLVERIQSNDPEFMMPPPESKLSLNAQEKAILLKWIEQGAAWKTHWSYMAPEKTGLPAVKNSQWPIHPIDHFILARLEAEGLLPSQEADKPALIRRLSFDLTGLPPTLEELDGFLNDHTHNAYEKVVDRLLDSPHFGERWCWDWLDAARYADTNGFQGDPERKMWPWRDWVVNALNANMPYDSFTLLQLAGDLLPNAGPEQILPTGFNRNHMYNGEGGRIPEETRVENVFDRVETTGTVWLGLTFNCTRCHDHKFDPITQKEYYQLFDYFNQTSEEGRGGGGRVPPVLNIGENIDPSKAKEVVLFLDKAVQKVENYEQRIFPRAPGQSAAQSPAAAQLEGDVLYSLGFPPKERNTYHLLLTQIFFEKRNKEYAALLHTLRSALGAKSNLEQKNIQVMVMDQLPEPRPTFVLERGLYSKPQERVYMNTPAVLPAIKAPIHHNRLDLAQWLVSDQNPLTARVTVNRFWQALFGAGIVKTADDFGVQGALPTHPELLDWLAKDFMENRWNVKKLIKQMVMSATYRQSSKAIPGQWAKDPENRFLARGPRHRLPSWMIRDQALSLSGLLNDSIGGPPVNGYQPTGIWEEATFGAKKYEQNHGEDLYRRTLYLFWRRIVGPTVIFDNAARQTCSVKPLITNSPQHALITLNDVTYVEAARVLAERIMTTRQTDEDRVSLAFRLATARLPDLQEKELMLKRLVQWKSDFEKMPEEAKKLVATGEYRQDETLNPADQAAYTALCSLILNLDETLTKQ